MEFRTGLTLASLFIYLLLPCVSMAGVSVTSGLTYEKETQPGGTYRGTIQLRNNGDMPQEVKIYQTDYLFFSDGRNIYGEPGKDPRSNADWITFSPHRFTIPPKGTSQVNYTLEVPDDKSLTGTYWSMLMVEGISSSSPEASRPKKDTIKVGISQVTRYGAQIRTQIGDTGARELKFVKTRLLKEDKKRILQLDIENIGERLLRPDLWVDLYDEKGKSIGKFKGGKLGVYPATSVRFKIDLSQVPKGTYKAMIVADCGDDDLFGATYTLKFQ
jgi:hypothetical protein